MRREFQRIDVGTHIRNIVTISDDPIPESQRRQRQFPFLKELIIDGIYSGLLNCGSEPFDTMSIEWDNDHWVCVIIGHSQT